MRASFRALLFLTVTVSAQSIVVQPPLNTFRLRADLTARHPRLHFAQADIAAIRARATGPGKWFYDKAKRDFGGYVRQRTPDAPGSWKDYLFGFWGQFTMDMVYVVEGDTAFANAARDWALFYARRSDWLKDDLIPMDISTGMALTYDILYDRLTPSERAELRAGLKRSIDTMMIHFFQGEYWTQDFQNNHMHNRIHGLAHAAFAMLGDDPGMNVQAAADLAAGCFQEVVRWGSPDGSTHEGPGYYDYGYHWAVRTGELIKFTTGTDPVASSSHFAADYLFRLYLCTPGFKGTFGIGDAGDGPPDNADAWLPALARARDGAADSVFRRLMKEHPGGFYQQTMWSLLWMDPALVPTVYNQMPLYRFWPDLEMFSIRGSWADTATAFVFKCGPQGGHRMQSLRGSDWVNVAHDHPDQNHFLLFAHNRLLAEDDGYPTDQKLTRSHNTLTIDSLGQPRDGDGWSQPYDYALSGGLDDIMLSGATACASGNASRLYTNASRFIRHAAFVEGGYVILTDDLTGKGTGQHTFDWRLHKAGIWSTVSPGHFIVDDSSNTRLDIRFLEPAAASLQGLFLPAELTAQPCLSIRVRAPSTRITALLTPQRNGQPVLKGTLLAATGGTGVEVRGSLFTDAYLLGADTSGITANDILCNGRENLVRKQGALPAFALMARGTRLSVAGRTLLRSQAPANLSWRSLSNGATMEAEPAYKAAGSSESIRIGGLVPGRSYSISIDGSNAGNATADTGGTAVVGLILDRRISIRLNEAIGTEQRAFAGAAEASLRVGYGPGGIVLAVHHPAGKAFSLHIFDMKGGRVWAMKQTETRSAGDYVAWAGRDLRGNRVSAGIYLARLQSPGINRCVPFMWMR